MKKEKEKKRSICLSDDTESRAEISAPQFGDNRIPPLHTILEVTVRHNTWHHVSWPDRGSLLNRWPFISLSHFLPIVVLSNEVTKVEKKTRKKKELLFPASLRSDKSYDFSFSNVLTLRGRVIPFLDPSITQIRGGNQPGHHHHHHRFKIFRVMFAKGITHPREGRRFASITRAAKPRAGF